MKVYYLKKRLFSHLRKEPNEKGLKKNPHINAKDPCDISAEIFLSCYEFDL